MDVPTHATRRIERYGVLALILFLTTFGVLYLWDGPGEETQTADAVLAGGPVAGYHPRSTARPVRPRGTDSVGDTRSTLPPLADEDLEQRHLATKQGARREATAEERKSAGQSEATFSTEERNKMVRHYRRTGTARGEDFDGPAPDVSVSGYSGRRSDPVKDEERASVPNEEEMEYVVESGDCLSKIAERELGSVKHLDRLKEVNGLSSDSLRVGQRLILPHIGDVAPVRGADLDMASKNGSHDWALVTVKEGDSLWKIAARELNDGNLYEEIMDWNSLKSETLQPGTELRIDLALKYPLLHGDSSR